MKLQNPYPLVIIALVFSLVGTTFFFTSKIAQLSYTSATINSLTTNLSPNIKSYSWRLVTSWPKNYPGLGTAPEKFAQLVAEMSNKRLQISVHGAGELVPALEVFDAVSRGGVEMAHSAAYYWKGKSPAAPFFTTIPFGMTAQEMNAWLHYGGGLALWKELYEPFNIIPLAGGNTGVQMAGWFNKEINSMADIKGLKMRIPGLGGEVLKRAGGTAVTIPGSEIYTSLQTGVIDATEWVGPANDRALGFHTISKFYYYPGWHEPGPTLELTVNRDAFMSLPQDLQTIVTVAARAINQDMLDEYTAKNNAALTDLLTNHGVQLKKLPDDVLRELRKLSDEVARDMVQGDELATRVYNSYKEFQKDAMIYNDISESAYMTSRTDQ